MPYIYLLHCRAALNAQEHVFKIGKSGDVRKRLNGYDKGSLLMFTIYVDEMDELEKKLIEIFKTKFIIRADYGREYFEGKLTDMITCIMTNSSREYKIPTPPEDVEMPDVVVKKPRKVIPKKVIIDLEPDCDNNFDALVEKIKRQRGYIPATQIEKNKLQSYLRAKLNRVTKFQFNKFASDLGALPNEFRTNPSVCYLSNSINACPVFTTSSTENFGDWFERQGTIVGICNSVDIGDNLDLLERIYWLI